mgnify:CR=1 FL=1
MSNAGDGSVASGSPSRCRKLLLTLIALQFLMIIGLAVALFYMSPPAIQPSGMRIASESKDMYVLYIGTNDPVTYLPRMSPQEARNIVDDICRRYVDGYTVQFAQGAWEDEQGNWTSEETLVYYISGAEEEAIIAIMDDALKALGQKSILMERNNVRLAYYGGDNGNE